MGWHRGLRGKGEPEPSDFRYITAIDLETGDTLWQRDYSEGEYLLPLTMAVKDERIAYKTTAGIVCLDSSPTLYKSRVPSFESMLPDLTECEM